MRSSSSLSLLLLFRLWTTTTSSSIIQRLDDQQHFPEQQQQQQSRIIDGHQSEEAASPSLPLAPSGIIVGTRWSSTWSAEGPAETIPAMSMKSRGFLVGDFCDDADQCNPGLPHTVCNAMTQRCECDPSFPIVVDDSICVPPLKLGEQCLYDQSCQYFDRNSVCAPPPEGTANECRCRAAFHPSITLESISRTSICIPEPHGPWLKSDVPTVIGLGVGMSVFMALTCLVLKLFSRARFAQEQARGYGNAHLAPPSSGPSANNTHSDGKHPHRQGNYNRQVSITDSEAAAAATNASSADSGPRRTNSITNGGHHHSRQQGSFYGRRYSSHSATYETRSPMRGSKGEANRDSAQQDTERSTSSIEQLHPLQP